MRFQISTANIEKTGFNFIQSLRSFSPLLSVKPDGPGTSREPRNKELREGSRLLDRVA